MKRPLFIGLFFLIAFSACQKNNTAGETINSITGSWKLTEVYDKNNASVIHPPAGTGIDVVLTFLDRSRFAGHTLRNTLSDGSYKQSGNEVTFQNFSMTKVGEDEWGASFLSVLNSCYLQSASPCVPSILTLQGNVMKIKTQLRYDITLEKL